MSEVKELNIKNRTYYYFNGIINKRFSFKLIKNRYKAV